MSDTLRETAERITVEVAKICGCDWAQCTNTRNATRDAIESALKAERERAAKVAEWYANSVVTMDYTLGFESEGGGVESDYSKGVREGAARIATAIRAED